MTSNAACFIFNRALITAMLKLAIAGFGKLFIGFCALAKRRNQLLAQFGAYFSIGASAQRQR